MSDGFESIVVECLFPGIDLVEADAVAGCLAGAKMMQRTMAMAGRKQIAVSTRCRARGRPRTKDNFLSRAFCIGIDQRWLVENCTIPLAAVNGSEYQPRYLEVPNYANLWEGSLSSARLEASAFLGSTGVFDELLEKFVDDVAPR